MVKNRRAAPEGYASGPDAPLRATADALARAGAARAVILVEGVSDQIALETAASSRGRDLGADGVVIVPIGGTHAIGRFLTRFGAGTPLAGLYDVREEEIVRRGVERAGLGTPATRADLAALGFFACVDDLEDELIRAVGVEEVEALFAAEGDLTAFRSMSAQPAWRGRNPVARMRRFLGGGARRKLRYARVLTEAAHRRNAVPRPLEAVLDAV